MCNKSIFLHVFDGRTKNCCWKKCSSYYREIVTTEKNLLGVCMLFVFLYDLVIIDESIRISKNDKFFILVKVAEYPIF